MSENVHKRRPRDLFGHNRERCWFFLTPRERWLADEFIIRMRAREVQLSILGLIRRAGVAVFLTGAGDDRKLRVRFDADVKEDKKQEQIKTISDNKELIISALDAEAAGDLWTHSALAADVGSIYRQTADNHEAGLARPECESLIAELDEFLMELDELSLMALPDMVAKYLARQPVMKELIRKVNTERASQLEGKELEQAVRMTFKDKIRDQTGINPAAFD